MFLFNFFNLIPSKGQAKISNCLKLLNKFKKKHDFFADSQVVRPSIAHLSTINYDYNHPNICMK